MSRPRPIARPTRVHAVLAAPLIHDIAADLDLGRPHGRRRRHPIALHLAWAALSRLYGSANRLDAELAHPDAWGAFVDTYNTAAANHPHGQPCPPHTPPLTADTHRHLRDRLTTDDGLEQLTDTFTRHAVTTARAIGLLDPHGGGSLTRPHPTRTIYGDGTVVRPIYSQSPTGTRVDHDAQAHRRHDGTIVGNNLVHLAVRGPALHQRVLLAIGRTPAPGGEAATAVELIRRVHDHAGPGIQAVVYDGAFRGVHHHTLMTDLGVTVVNKVHPAGRDGDQRLHRPHTLGTWTHAAGRRAQCNHTLVAHNGAVCDTTLTATGELELSPPLRRQQVRRYARRRRGGWRFSLGVAVTCPYGDFTAWISPHPEPGDATHGRPDQLRLLPEHDPHFAAIYGLRNDSEAINAEYKRTLPADRAAALGWRRQVLDLHAWALLNNTLAWHVHAPMIDACAA